MDKIMTVAIAVGLFFGVAAPSFAAGPDLPGITADPDDGAFDRRGRGGRSKPRVPGGSGCDDPRDIIEHPECSA